jgi:hypothetical protein
MGRTYGGQISKYSVHVNNSKTIILVTLGVKNLRENLETIMHEWL